MRVFFSIIFISFLVSANVPVTIAASDQAFKERLACQDLKAAAQSARSVTPEEDSSDIYWDDQFPNGTNGTVFAIVVDATGRVYVGGDFTTAGGVSADHIAKWENGVWSPLGPGLNGIVYALAEHDGVVYAGGEFTLAGGPSVSKVAKWESGAWSDMNGGMNNTVNALVVSGTTVYAAGWFTYAGATNANYIAKWDGSNWLPMGTGMNDVVYALADSNGVLIAGGTFTTAGGATANYIAKWYSGSWSQVGTGMNQAVFALAAGNYVLFAGGDFTMAGGATANHIAKFENAVWSPLGTGVSNTVSALTIRGGALCVGGWFGMAGGVTCSLIAKWEGGIWSTFGSGLNGGVNALALRGSALYAGGWFTTAGGKSSAYFAQWQPRVNLSKLLLAGNPGEATLGGDLSGFYQPALSTVIGTTVSHAGGVPVQATMERADEIQVTGIRVNGAFSLSPPGITFSGAGAALKVEFSEDDVTLFGGAYTDFRVYRLIYPLGYPIIKDTLSGVPVSSNTPMPVRVENGKQIYAVLAPLTAMGFCYGAVPQGLLSTPTPNNTPTNIPNNTPTPPVIISNLFATTDHINEVIISWSGSADWFRVYRANSNGTFGQISSGPVTGHSYADLNVVPNINYYYKVQGINGTNSAGALSDAVMGKARPPVQPAIDLAPLVSSLTLERGKTGAFVFNIAPLNGFTGSVTLHTSSNPPPGVNLAFQPNVVSPPAQARLYAQAGTNTATGTTNLVVEAYGVTSGGTPCVDSATVTLKVLSSAASGYKALVMDVGRTQLPLGAATTIKGRLICTQPADATVTIMATHPSVDTMYVQTRTDSQGRYSLILEPTALGTWTVQGGVSAPISVVSQQEQIIVGERTGAISLGIKEDDFVKNSLITVGGRVRANQGFNNVSITGTSVTVALQAPSGGSLVVVATTTVQGASNYYQVQVNLPNETGAAVLQAIWAGKEGFSLGAVSPLIRFEIGSARRVAYDPGVAIVVAGAGDTSRTDAQLSVLTNSLYATMRDRRYNEVSRMKYLNQSNAQDTDHDGLPNPLVVDASSTSTDLQNAITFANSYVTADKPLAVFLCTGLSSGNLTLGNGDNLPASQLASMVGATINPSVPVRFIIDGPDAGTYGQTLVDGHATWTALAAVQTGQPVYLQDGAVSFSSYMATNAMVGMSIQEAFQTSEAMLRLALGGPVSPALPQCYPDSFLTDPPVYFGLAYTDTDMLAPAVDDLTEPQVFEGQSGLQVQARVIDDVAVSTVQGTVFMSDGGTQSFTLAPTGSRRVLTGTGWYAGAVPGISGPGMYRIVIVGQDSSGNVSEPAETYLSLETEQTGVGKPEVYK